MKKPTKNIANTSTHISEVDQAIIKAIIAGKVQLSGFEQLVFQAGQASTGNRNIGQKIDIKITLNDDV